MKTKEIKDALVGQTILIETDKGEMYARIAFVGLKVNGNFDILNTHCSPIASLTREQAEDLTYFGSTCINGHIVHVVNRNIDWEQRQWDIYKTLMANYNIKDESVFSPKPSLMYQLSEKAVSYYKERTENSDRPTTKEGTLELARNLTEEDL